MPNSRLLPLSIICLPIATLVANPRNARTHSRRQIRQIAASLRQFGFINPVIIDRNNRIIAGHGRVEAAKLEGMEEVPAIVLEDLTDDQIRAYVLADNGLAEKAGWDREILAIELQHLVNLDDLDVTITGFEVPEIDLILEEARVRNDQDDAVEIHEGAQVITQMGDLWKLDKHRVFCGNALDLRSFETLMANRRATAVFVDPPYNVPIDQNVCGKGSVRHREFAMASGEMSGAEFEAFLVTALGRLARHSTNGSVHFVCMDWRHIGELLAAGSRTYELLLNVCVWVKDNGGMGSFYRSRHELVFVFRNGKAPHEADLTIPFAKLTSRAGYKVYPTKDRSLSRFIPVRPSFPCALKYGTPESRRVLGPTASPMIANLALGSTAAILLTTAPGSRAHRATSR